MAGVSRIPKKNAAPRGGDARPQIPARREGISGNRRLIRSAARGPNFNPFSRPPFYTRNSVSAWKEPSRPWMSSSDRLSSRPVLNASTANEAMALPYMVASL